MRNIFSIKSNERERDDMSVKSATKPVVLPSFASIKSSRKSPKDDLVNNPPKLPYTLIGYSGQKAIKNVLLHETFTYGNNFNEQNVRKHLITSINKGGDAVYQISNQLNTDYRPLCDHKFYDRRRKAFYYDSCNSRNICLTCFDNKLRVFRDSLGITIADSYTLTATVSYFNGGGQHIFTNLLLQELQPYRKQLSKTFGFKGIISTAEVAPDYTNLHTNNLFFFDKSVYTNKDKAIQVVYEICTRAFLRLEKDYNSACTLPFSDNPANGYVSVLVKPSNGCAGGVATSNMPYDFKAFDTFNSAQVLSLAKTHGINYHKQREILAKHNGVSLDNKVYTTSFFRRAITAEVNNGIYLYADRGVLGNQQKNRLFANQFRKDLYAKNIELSLLVNPDNQYAYTGIPNALYSTLISEKQVSASYAQAQQYFNEFVYTPAKQLAELGAISVLRELLDKVYAKGGTWEDKKHLLQDACQQLDNLKCRLQNDDLFAIALQAKDLSTVLSNLVTFVKKRDGQFTGWFLQEEEDVSEWQILASSYSVEHQATSKLVQIGICEDVKYTPLFSDILKAEQFLPIKKIDVLFLKKKNDRLQKLLGVVRE